MYNFSPQSKKLIITIIPVLIIAAIIIILWKTEVLEKFTSSMAVFDSSIKTGPKLEKKYVVQSSSGLLSNGMVYNYASDVEGEIVYVYKFNLPTPDGGDFTKSNGIYSVVAGADKASAKPVGRLYRANDGWYYYVVKTKENLSGYTSIVYSGDDTEYTVLEA